MFKLKAIGFAAAAAVFGVAGAQTSQGGQPAQDKPRLEKPEGSGGNMGHGMHARMHGHMDPHKQGSAAQPPEKSGAGNKQPSHEHGQGK